MACVEFNNKEVNGEKIVAIDDYGETIIILTIADNNYIYTNWLEGDLKMQDDVGCHWGMLLQGKGEPKMIRGNDVSLIGTVAEVK